MILPWEGALLAGVVALDETAAGQFMVARPIVAGFLTGLLFGDPGTGLMVGGLLEIFALAELPSGGARMAESGPGAVVAVAVAVHLPLVAQVPLAVAFGLLSSELAGYTVHRLRVWTGTRWRRIEERGVTGRRVRILHWSTLGLEWLRGVGLYLVLVPLGVTVLVPLAKGWPLGFEPGWALILVGAGVHLGVFLRRWGGWSRRRWTALAGILGGLGLGLWL